MPRSRHSRRSSPDIWPGFVDALASLLMVIIFVIMVFVLAQFFLSQALSGRDQQVARLTQEVASLAEQLSLERQSSSTLKVDLSRLSGELQANLAEQDRVASEMAALRSQRDELQGQATSQTQRAEEAEARSGQFERQLAALQQQMAALNAALEAAEKLNAEQKVQIADLGKRLNVALAGKVEELQRYRSEFFGKLRAVLGNRPGIRIEGDRFVFQSELLFEASSAELPPRGLDQVRHLAQTLIEISRQFPKDVNWVLRVDGHTDRRKISSGKYPSNWELSSARALSVLRALIDNGIPPERVMAAGFGEFHPLDPADTEAAWARNRRIEVRLDQR